MATKPAAPVVSKKEMEKRVERVQKLRKQECNKVCFDCGERGPQSACTTFNVFVCMMCHGIHREFNHRVKSISMSTFDESEVAGLEAGGNEVGRKYWLARFKETDFPIPDINEPRVIREKRIRDFIRMKYIEKRWIPAEEPEKKKKKKKAKKEESSSEEESDSEDSEEEREKAKKKAEKEARKAAKAAKAAKKRDSSPTPPLKQLTDVLPEFKDKLVVTAKSNGHDDHPHDDESTEKKDKKEKKKKDKKDKDDKKKKDVAQPIKAAPQADSGAKSSSLLDFDDILSGGAAAAPQPSQSQQTFQPQAQASSWDAFGEPGSSSAATSANEWATFDGSSNGFVQAAQPPQSFQQPSQASLFVQPQQPPQSQASLFDGNPFASPPSHHHSLQQPQSQSFQTSFQQPTFPHSPQQQNPLTAHQPALNFVVPAATPPQQQQQAGIFDFAGPATTLTTPTPQVAAPSSSPGLSAVTAPSSQRRALDGDPFADIMSGSVTSDFAQAASAQNAPYNSNRQKNRYAVDGPAGGKTPQQHIQQQQSQAGIAGMTGLHSTPGGAASAGGSAAAYGLGGGMGMGMGGMGITPAPLSNSGLQHQQQQQQQQQQLLAQQQMMAQQQAVLQQQLYAQVGAPAGAGGQYSPQQHQQVQILYQQYMQQQMMMMNMMAAQGRGYAAVPAAGGFGAAPAGGAAGANAAFFGGQAAAPQQPAAAAGNPFAGLF